MRERAVAMLGGRCACCGQNRSVFLQFDHVNNDGMAHRRQLSGSGTGSAITRWALKNPEEALRVLQVLCANCNMAKAIEENHSCPPTT